MDYIITLGTVYPKDANFPMPNIYAYIIKSKIQDNDIIILHDRWWTSSTLKKCIPFIKEKYSICALCSQIESV
jgi:hypothetical protein